jgi:hypothetical protein
MTRRLQKQTWVELRRLFVSGWSHGKLAKRFGVPKGSIAARCAREKWARERIEGQTLHGSGLRREGGQRRATPRAHTHARGLESYLRRKSVLKFRLSPRARTREDSLIICSQSVQTVSLSVSTD